MANRRFTLMDVVSETVLLARSRRTYFLVLLSAFTTALLTNVGLRDYFLHTIQRSFASVAPSDKAAASSCAENILKPWVIAALRKNLSAFHQEDFYVLSLLNCTMFKSPAEMRGEYTFKNGSFELRSKDGFTLASAPGPTRSFERLALELLYLVWTIWGLVSVAWGLHAATTTTPSRDTRPRLHRDAISTGPQNLRDVIREQYSGKVFRGVIRVSLTMMLADLLFIAPTDYLGTMVRAVVADRGTKFLAVIPRVRDLWKSSRSTWGLANPLRLLFLLSGAAAALEPGTWGFKALWRAIQLIRGNWWNSLLIHVPLSLWEWLCVYVQTVLLNPADQLTESILWLSLRSMAMGSLKVGKFLPRFFVVPVFYFFCKSWREKVGTIA